MSMRWLHRLFDLLLYTYPPSFRREYAVEMQQLFRDRCREAQPRGASRFAFHILGDAAKSAMREWFSPSDSAVANVPATATPDGVPVFFIFEDERPRPRILLQGGLASVLAFAAVAFAASYGHPTLRVQLSGLTLPMNRPRPVAARPPEPPGLWQQFLSRFNRPAVASVSVTVRSKVPAQEQPVRSKDKTWLEWLARERGNSSRAVFVNVASSASAIPDAPVIPIHLPRRVLRSYAGKYLIDPPFDLKISITAMRDSLILEAAEQPKLTLVAVSRTKFKAGDARWVEFAKDPKGRMRLTLAEPGWKIEARRPFKKRP
jgi:hypothetical protein